MSTTDLSQNVLLASLPASIFNEVKMHAAVVNLEQGAILCENSAEVDEVYFPLAGVISLVFKMKTGKAIEIGTIGREGIFGAMAGLGMHMSRVKAVVTIPTIAARMSAPTFRRLVAKYEIILTLVVRCNDVLLYQAQVNAACNALHRTEHRLARWLLQTSDQASSAVLNLTQGYLAQLLGVRRTSVTEVAGNFKDGGIIAYSRGAITILDREALEGVACECYQKHPVRESLVISL